MPPGPSQPELGVGPNRAGQNDSAGFRAEPGSACRRRARAEPSRAGSASTRTVNCGLVQAPVPINICQWNKVCYTNIPQQTDGHSCGAYTLKYMLSWDGEKMAEHFTQSQIHIFSWKICSSLLRSDRNLLRKESYKIPITKAAYEASIEKLVQPNAADDDVQEISPPDAANNKENSPPDAASKKGNPPHDASKSGISGSPKRKRGRPRKIKPIKPTSPVIEQFATNAIAARVEGRGCRKTQPGPHKLSPYKEL